MKVSVIVLTYNRAQMVKEAIDSILNQTFKDFELIIVDNYSSDDTESVVKSYVDKRIRYFKNQNNGFIGVNRNYGIQKSGGEYIAFLDDDDIWLPEKLEKQVDLLDSNRELGLVYSDSYVIDSNGDFQENTLLYGSTPVRGDAFSELLQFNFIPMLTVIIRREVLDKVGGFNPKYIVALDYDLWLRIAEYYPIDFIEQPLAKYRVHDERATLKNLEPAWHEQFQLIRYWLERKPNLERELGAKIKQKKTRLHFYLMRYYFHSRENRKAIVELVNLIRLFPYSMVLVPGVITKLWRRLV